MLTINRKFNFSAAHRSLNPLWSDEKNLHYYDNGFLGDPGHGHNYQAFFIFSGPIDEKTGMVMELSKLKRLVEENVVAGYDHKFINEDVAVFKNRPVTTENLALYMLKEAECLFENEVIHPVSCHVIESDKAEATAYSGGLVERYINLKLPVNKANEETFCQKKLDLKLVIAGSFVPETGVILPEANIKKICGDLIRDFRGRDCLCKNPLWQIAKDIWEYVEDLLPIRKVVVVDDSDCYFEYIGDDQCVVVVRDLFCASHKLINRELSEEKNRELFGKCHQFHGHSFNVELAVKVAGCAPKKLLCELAGGLKRVIDPWRHQNLNKLEVFSEQVSTGELVIQVLKDKITKEIGRDVYRLRLWETDNNRFCLR